jgi:ABC-2 type transport system permease protein
MDRGGIVGHEVRRQLGSSASWLIVGFFALLSGIAFVVTLNTFLDLSTQALSAPPAEPININQLLIRPFLLRVGLAALFVLPLITARANTASQPAASRRTVVASFVGMLALYAVMLLASLAPVAALFLFGAPEWGSIATGYLGLLMMGAAFISVALFISSLVTSPVAAGFATFAISLMLTAAAWLARAGTAGAQPVFRYFSAGEVLDDFAKGVIDSGHVVSCLTIIALGVFLARLTIEQPSDNRQPSTDP